MQHAHRLLLVLLMFLSLGACNGNNNNNNNATNPAGEQSTASPAFATESARLNAWFDARNEERLAFSPMSLTSLGRKDLYDQLDDYSLEGRLAYLQWLEASVQDLEAAFDYTQLDFETQSSWDLWHWMADSARQNFEYRNQQFVFDQMNGTHTGLPTFLISSHRVDDVRDMEAYISRISAIGRAIRQNLEHARNNAAFGVRPPRFAYTAVILEAGKVISGLPFVADANTDAPLFTDGKAKLAALQERAVLDDAEAEELTQQLESALRQDFLPAYQDLIAWFEQDIDNAAEQAQGASALPDGEAYYRYQLARNTTLQRTADEVHAIGLAEVARIRAEMLRVKDSMGFDGDLQAFFRFLNTDDAFFYPNTDEGREGYLDDTRAYLAFITEKLPDYFGILPKAPLDVKRVEPFREQDGAPQHYRSGSIDGSRPGIYYVHLLNTRSMPKTEMEAVAYHEGLPGHHMQISIALELTGLPAFRGQVSHTAYVEGWALYAEQLAGEMGAYEDPYRYFGRLTSEMWRAIRLVVDTGLHSKGWTEQQAIDYFAANASTPLPTITAEVRRYLVMPGQATAYKTGMMEILALRQQAMDTLGDAFDIREFHDVVLGGGSLPLEILGKRVSNWLAGKAAPAPQLAGFDLTLVDVDGTSTVLGQLPPSVFAPRLSPDASRISFETRDPSSTDGARLWTADLLNIDGRQPLPLVIDAVNWAPMWSPDGEDLVFIVSGAGPDAVYRRRADGTGEAEHLLDTRSAEGWVADGAQLRFLSLTGNGDYGISLFDMASRTTTLLVDLPDSAQHSSAMSPDGKWMAYASNETGRYEVWIEPFPPTGERHQLTREGGAHPLWLPDGQGLYFDRDQQMFRLDLNIADLAAPVEPTPLPIRGFVQGEYRRQFDLMPDGRRFLMLFPVSR